MPSAHALQRVLTSMSSRHWLLLWTNAASPALPVALLVASHLLCRLREEMRAEYADRAPAPQ
jgi:hypothetical protein